MVTQEGEDTWGSPLLRRGIYCLAVRESFHVWLHCAWTSCKQNQNKTKQHQKTTQKEAQRKIVMLIIEPITNAKTASGPHHITWRRDAGDGVLQQLTRTLVFWLKFVV